MDIDIVKIVGMVLGIPLMFALISYVVVTTTYRLYEARLLPTPAEDETGDTAPAPEVELSSRHWIHVQKFPPRVQGDPEITEIWVEHESCELGDPWEGVQDYDCAVARVLTEDGFETTSPDPYTLPAGQYEISYWYEINPPANGLEIIPESFQPLEA